MKNAIGFCSNLLCKPRFKVQQKCKQIQNGMNGAITMSKQIQNGQNVRPKNTSKYWLSMNTGADKSFMCVYDIQK